MFNVRKNMTFNEFIQSRFYIINDVLRYRKAFKNYLQVIYHTLKKEYPILVVLKNSEKKLLNNRIEVYTSSLGLENHFKIIDNLVTITEDSKTIQLYDAIGNGDVCGIFLKEEYKFLPVKDRIVIDIGANIGDSAIYFALKGAKKIIALEPFPRNFNSAKKNIELNNLSDKIELQLAGCSSKTGEMIVNSIEGSSQSSLRESSEGKNIPLLTLENIIKNNKIESALLKMDCEGCEYDSILNSSEDTLKKFSHIQLEYHYGYKNIKNKLEKCGFEVSITKPIFNLNYEASESKMYIGFLYAKKLRETKIKRN